VFLSSKVKVFVPHAIDLVLTQQRSILLSLASLIKDITTSSDDYDEEER